MAEVIKSGPLFDGRAAENIRVGIAAARRQVAADGEKLVRGLFEGSIRENHGRFLASITTIEDSHVFVTVSGGHTYTLPVVVDRSTETAVTTSLASYGPYLEGVGSRNETTRFKGYHGFRRASEELNRTAGHTVARTLEPYVKKANL